MLEIPEQEKVYFFLLLFVLEKSLLLETFLLEMMRGDTVGLWLLWSSF